jgi:hypothetical protein
MNDLIGDIFEFLKDGHWHARRDLELAFSIDNAIADQIIGFLERFDLLNTNSDGSEIIIDPKVLRLLVRDIP